MDAEHPADQPRTDARGQARAETEVEVEARAPAARRHAPDVRSPEADGGVEVAVAVAAQLVEALVVQRLKLADPGQPPSRPASP